MLAVLCTVAPLQAALVPLTISLPSSSPLATAPARAALPSHHTLSHSTQSVSNLGIFPSSETSLPVPSSLLASEEKTLSEEDLEKACSAYDAVDVNIRGLAETKPNCLVNFVRRFLRHRGTEEQRTYWIGFSSADNANVVFFSPAHKPATAWLVWAEELVAKALL